MIEDDNKQPQGEVTEIEEIGYPDETWYDLRELDEEDHVISYTMNGKKKAMKYCFKARNKNEMKAIRAEHQSRGDTGIIQTDEEKLSDDTILSCVGTKTHKGKFVPMTRQQLDKIKQNKKNGLHAALWLQAIRQSDANLDLEKIEKEKN